MSCSVNAGIIARSGIRQRLTQAALDGYRYTIIESDNLYNFNITPPSIQRKFLARHIYRYLRPFETFAYIGQQKGQAVEVNKWSEYGFTINNTNLINLNNNKLYSNIDPDPGYAGISVNNDQDILKDLFKYKNLYDNQVVFIDITWVGFDDGRRRSIDDWWPNTVGSIDMNAEKGHVFRVGTISKESINYINEMVYLDINPGDNFNPPKRNQLYI